MISVKCKAASAWRMLRQIRACTGINNNTRAQAAKAMNEKLFTGVDRKSWRVVSQPLFGGTNHEQGIK